MQWGITLAQTNLQKLRLILKDGLPLKDGVLMRMGASLTNMASR